RVPASTTARVQLRSVDPHPEVSVAQGRGRSPRHAPVSLPPRCSMNSLKLAKSPLTRRSSTPALSPTFSTNPSGSMLIWTVTLVLLSSRRWNVTTPACSGPSSAFHATRSSGCCSVIVASNSRTAGPTFVTQCRWRSSSCRTSSTPSMNSGKDSNCVHWLYAVETSTSTSTASVIVLMCSSSSGPLGQAYPGGPSRTPEPQVSALGGDETDVAQWQ